MDYKQYANCVLAELSTSLLTADEPKLNYLMDAILNAERIFCEGKGRSGLSVNGFAMRLAQMGLTSYVVSETTTPNIKDNDLFIICSGSGETPNLIEHAAKASAIGANIVLITTNPNSTISGISHEQIIIAAPKKDDKVKDSVQPMSTLFEQAVGILFDIIILLLMEKRSISSEEMYKNHKNLE